MNIIEKLREKSETDRATAEAAWTALVARLAAGEPVNEREAATVLKAIKRTIDELEAAVGREQRITELRGIVATWPDALEKMEGCVATEMEFNLERQAEFCRNRDAGIIIRTSTLEARCNFDAIETAQTELDSLIGEVT